MYRASEMPNKKGCYQAPFLIWHLWTFRPAPAEAPPGTRPLPFCARPRRASTCPPSPFYRLADGLRIPKVSRGRRSWSHDLATTVLADEEVPGASLTTDYLRKIELVSFDKSTSNERDLTKEQTGPGIVRTGRTQGDGYQSAVGDR